MSNDVFTLIVNTIFISFSLFQLINLLFILGGGIRILDRHYSKHPERESTDFYSAGFRYANYCFVYPLGALRTRSIWINLWMIHNSLFTVSFWVVGTLGVLGIFD